MNAWGRVAQVTFWLHVGLIAFSTVSMVTILAGPMDPWLATEPAATVTWSLLPGRPPTSTT